MSFNIEWKGSNVIVSLTKNFVYKDSYEANSLIYGDSRFDTMKYQIVDCSKIEKAEFTEDEIKIITTLEKSSSIWNNKIKMAVVTSDTVCLDFMLDPYFEGMKNTNWEFKTFKNIIEAEKWCTE